jgi:hypothetical protein
LCATPGDLLHSIANPSSDPNRIEYFGYSIANLGNTFVVGCYGDDSSGVPYSGSVYQFDSNTFNVIRNIPNPAPRMLVRFGKSVAAIGSNFAAATAADDVANTIYYFDGNTGEVLRTIVPPAGKSFGGVASNAVTITEVQGRLAVQGSDNVMTFDLATGNLALDIPGPVPDPYFGRFLAERGSEIVVGGLRNIYVFDGASGNLVSTIASPLNTQLGQMTVTPAGHIFATYGERAYLFDGVSHQTLLTIETPTMDRNSCCLAAVGNTLIIGNKFYNGSEGIAYLFDGSTGQLLRTINNPSGGGSASSGEYFGETIVPFGNNFMIGVIQADLLTDPSRDAGAVYLFEGGPVPVPEPSTPIPVALGLLWGIGRTRKRSTRCGRRAATSIKQHHKFA